MLGLTRRTQRVAIWSPDASTIVAHVQGRLTNVSFITCRGIDELIRAAEDATVCLFVDTAASWQGSWGVGPYVWMRGRRVLVYTTLASTIAPLVEDMCASVSHGAICLKDLDDPCSDLSELLQLEEAPSPAVPLIRELARFTDAEVRRIRLACVVLGRRRRHVADIGDACAVSPRTIEWRLKRAGDQRAYRLLGWSLALHSVWRLDVLGWPLKKVAGAAGFADSERLSNYVRRHVGRSPASALRHGGFRFLLNAWREGNCRSDVRPDSIAQDEGTLRALAVVS